jgi:2-haloacid dehalogenase
MNPLDRVEILSFDCYGTLIDWQAGIREVLKQLGAAYGLSDRVDALLTAWEEIQFDLIAGPWRPYRHVLRESLDQLFCRHCVTLRADEADLLAERIGTWPPFEDVPVVLPRLKARYKLAILSNIDDRMLAASVAPMGVEFDELITAEQVRSYKPRPAHFQEAVRRFGAPADRFLHCAFGFKYDQTPARALGMSTAWVKRPGWVRDDQREPSYQVDSLFELAEVLEVESCDR